MLKAFILAITSMILVLVHNAFHRQIKIYENDIKRCVINASISRIRPILLTVETTVLGLIPVITKLNIDFFALQIIYDAPSSQWWLIF
ncbi:hypothetical protein [Wolbachia endosymbiont of Brugia malayi]|uniref:hypothetical protein n=1 Tax=Wolbachia endosymbiont of Brugia malayi TaxID=80849 RepID=UPI001CDC9D44|nr:hypothetical protein [Wolbachia endosymbiont of Brugia malayi]